MFSGRLNYNVQFDKNSISQGGSDLFGYISNVVASIVGGITSLVLNASLGSSGGSSQGSADLSGGSSAAASNSHPAPDTDQHHH